jgi:hypothetical protein
MKISFITYLLSLFFSEQMMISPSIQFVFFVPSIPHFVCHMIILLRTSKSSPPVIQSLNEKKEEKVEHYTYKFEYNEGTNKTTRKNNYKPVAVIKQARMLSMPF